MRVEYWARIRFRAGSYYMTLPALMAKNLMKQEPELVGKEVRVEVTL